MTPNLVMDTTNVCIYLCSVYAYNLSTLHTIHDWLIHAKTSYKIIIMGWSNLLNLLCIYIANIRHRPTYSQYQAHVVGFITPRFYQLV